MATQLEPKELDLQEQIARIRKTQEEVDKFAAETRKVVADMIKTQADTKFQPWILILQGALAAAALMGAGVAFAKLFLA